MKDTLILVLAYFNHKDVDETLKSLFTPYKDKQIAIPFDVVVLENPSKYSEQMKAVVNKYDNHILKHFRAKENVELFLFQYFLNNFRHITDNYKFIGISEGDVILDPEAFDECYMLINKYKNVGNVSIDLSLKNLQIPPLPESARNWISSGRIYEDYIEGPTGFQFVLFRKSHLDEFLYHVNNKLLNNHIALGVKDYHGMVDTNLIHFNKLKNTPWIRTKRNKLLHIGWEHFKDPKDEYWLTRTQSINDKKIRINVDVTKIVLECIK